MSKISVVMQSGHDDSYVAELEEGYLMQLLGCGGGCYKYGDTVEIHYERGYIKRNRISGDVLKAVYFCQ